MRMRRFCARQMLLHCIYYVTCYFRSKHTKIVGGYHEKNSNDKTVTVFPEIFIDCCKMFHSLSLFFMSPAVLLRLSACCVALLYCNNSIHQLSNHHKIFSTTSENFFSKLPHC